MASGNWEKDLRDKLRHLAGGNATWLADAVRAVFKEEEAMKRVILEEPDDETARQLVNDSIRRAASSRAGAGAAADDKDRSSVLVHEMLNRLGPPPELPRNADELAALLEDYSQLKIPVPASMLPWLKNNLNPTLWTLLDPVQGLQSPASKLSDLIADPTMADGKEGSTALTMQVLFRTVMHILGTLSAWRVRPDVSFNLTERGSCSISSAVAPRLRPDMIVTYASCTMLIGEDKEADMLDKAEKDIKVYGKLGIPAAQYGIIPGIPAYAASGSNLQFMFIPRGGTSAQVRTAGTIHDLDTVVGRLTALCAVIQCYRLMVAMSRSLPDLPDRTPLWSKVERGGASITLTPAGAVKKIGRFKPFAQPHGMTQASLKDAYKAAAAAAQQQRNQGLKPFLVSAAEGPTFTGDRFEVSTTPLGYNRHITTEADARRLASSCLHAAGALHAAKVVHTDLRLRNIVWLDEGHCMVLDLEHCRHAGTPLPDGVPSLEGWDDQTLETLPNGKKVFTPASDLYQVGKLLQGLGVEALQQSQLAQEFVHMLLGKRSLSAPGQPLTAEEALQHAWLQAQ